MSDSLHCLGGDEDRWCVAKAMHNVHNPSWLVIPNMQTVIDKDAEDLFTLFQEQHLFICAFGLQLGQSREIF